MSFPKLSIITINLNNKAGLRKTIRSVVSQTYADYEYILIDGGSTDGSVDVIKEHDDRISYWVSEPDKGIYNAMNKGIKMASGDYCLFLNSGDYFLNSTVLEICLNSLFTEDIIYGNVVFDRQGILETFKTPAMLTFYYFYINSIPHPCSFIKRDLFFQIGLYNERYKIVSDWEFFLKAIFLKNSTLKYIDKEIAAINCTGISMNSGDLCEKERSAVLTELFPGFLPDYEKLHTYNSSTTILYSRNKYVQNLAKQLNSLIKLKGKLFHK